VCLSKKAVNVLDIANKSNQSSFSRKAKIKAAELKQTDPST
jgi:hypothetical protein